MFPWSATIVFLACVGAVVADECRTGLTPVRTDTDELSSQTMTFKCNTIGPGATEILLGNSGVIEHRHSTFENGNNVTESRLDGDITTGNLSRTSVTIENGTVQFCYSTDILVRLSENTRCKTLCCRTRFNNDVVPYGNETVTNVPPSPSNIRIVNQTSDDVTVAWDPVIDVTHYDVSTTNCGTCPSRVNHSTVTCNIPRQREALQCNFSVRAIAQCAVSGPMSMTLYFQDTVTMDMPESRTGKIVGGVVGGIASLLSIILFVFFLTRVSIKLRRGESPQHRNDQVPLDDKTIKVNGTKSDPKQPENTLDDDVNIVRRSLPEDESPQDTIFTTPFNQTVGVEDALDDSVAKDHSFQVSKDRLNEPATTVALNGTGENHELVPKYKCDSEDVSSRLNKIEATLEEIPSMKSRIASLEDELQRLREEYAELSTKYMNDKKKHAAEEERLKAKIRDLEQQLSAAKVKAERLRMAKRKDSRRCQSCDN